MNWESRMNYKIKNACTRASILESYYQYKFIIYALWYTNLQHYETSIAVVTCSSSLIVTTAASNV